MRIPSLDGVRSMTNQQLSEVNSKSGETIGFLTDAKALESGPPFWRRGLPAPRPRPASEAAAMFAVFEGLARSEPVLISAAPVSTVVLPEMCAENSTALI